MKRYCVVSGSRTGSSLMQFVLWRYVKRKFGYHRALGDLMLRNWLYDTGSSLSNIRLTHMTPHDEWNMEIDREFEFNRRIDLLRKYHHQPYLVKFPACFWIHCDDEHLQYLYDNYHFVITDRQDKMERALSYTISIISNWFTVRKEEDIKRFVPGEFTDEIGEMILYDFRSLVEAQNRIRQSGAAHTVVQYEDMLRYGNRYEMLGGELGLDDWKTYIREEDLAQLPKKVGGLIDKRSFVTNWNYFNEWFNDYLA